MSIYQLVLAIMAMLPGPGRAQTSQPDLLCLNPSKLYPDMEDCRRFIRCVNRKPVSFSCPPKTAFDPETQICIWRLHLGDCSQQRNKTIDSKSTVNASAAEKSLVVVETSNRLPEDDSQHAYPVYPESEDTTSADENPLSYFHDFIQNFNTPRRNENINSQSTISNSASRSNVKYQNLNMHNLDLIINGDASSSHPVTIPVISDESVNPRLDDSSSNTKIKNSADFDNSKLTIDEDTKKSINSMYTTIEDTTTGENFEFKLNENTAKGNSSKHNVNEAVTSLGTQTVTNETSEVQTSSTELYQSPQLKTASGKMLTSVAKDAGGSLLASTNEITRETTVNISQLTPAWITSMIDSQIPVQDNSDIKNTASSESDVNTMSRDLPQKETVRPVPTTEMYGISLPMASNENPVISTTVKNDVDDNFIDQKNDDSKIAIRSEKTNESVLGSKDEINQQQKEDKVINSVSNENSSEAQVIDASQIEPQATDIIKEGIAEYTVTTFPTESVETASFQSDAQPESMAHQRIRHTKEINQEVESVNNGDPYGGPYTTLTPAYYNTLNTDLNQSPLQLQSSLQDATDDNLNSQTEKVQKIGRSRNFSAKFFEDDAMALGKLENISDLYNKNESENIRSDASFSVNSSLEVTSTFNILNANTTPRSKLNLPETSPERNEENLFVTKAASTAAPEYGNTKSISGNSNFDSSTLTSRTLLGETRHVTAAAGRTQISQLKDPEPTLKTSEVERTLNASFMSVPYMIQGLVRPFRCPQAHGHFVDPRNCSVYYHCSGGQAYRRDCPVGHVFHLATLACVSANQAPPCSQVNSTVQEHDYDEGYFRCEADGYFRDTKDCNVYYICSAGSSMRMTCDPGTSFDVTHNLCLWNSEVQDCNGGQSDTQNKIAADKLAIKKALNGLLDLPKYTIQTQLQFRDYICPEKNGVFPDLSNCSIYHICSGDVAKHVVCPRGTGYDAILEICAEEAQFDRCMLDNEFDVKVHDTGINLPASQFVCPEAHGLYPDPTNCSAFIHCFKKVPYKHTCQEGTVFSSEIGVCTWKEFVPECQTVPGHPSLKDTKMNKSLPLEIHLVKQDLVPEPYKLQSDNSELPDSNEPRRPVGVPDFVCPAVADGFFRDNLFCDIFHRCVVGTRFTFTCPSGTFFTLKGDMCDFWEKVKDCTQDGLRIEAVRSLPETGTLQVIQPTSNEVDSGTFNVDADPVPCPESSGLFAHPRNCHQFLFCAQFLPLVLTCPDTLLYNPLTLTCDLSKNVQCLRYDDYKKL